MKRLRLIIAMLVMPFLGIAQQENKDFTETAFGINMKMVYVEGGTFIMGCTEDQDGECRDDESPNRKTTVGSFYIGMLEITQIQWEKVMGTTIYQQRDSAGSSNTYGTGAEYPMYYVSWEEAKKFCARLSRYTGRNYSLPTEAEWEYAARGGKKKEGTKYSGSQDIDEVAWCDDNNDSNSTHPCGTKRSNALGIYDMSGNVYEWCEDWYSNKYIQHDNNNPKGPSNGSDRVVRGGNWYNYAQRCRIARREFCEPKYRGKTVGFRVALHASPKEELSQHKTRPSDPDSLLKWCMEKIDSADYYSGQWDSYRGVTTVLDALPLDLSHPEFPLLPEAEFTFRQVLCSETGRFTGHDDIPLSVHFSPDGKLLVSASKDNTIRLWDPLSGRLLKTLIGHGKKVSAAAFSPDGKKIASASSDYTVRQWDVATGQIINTPSLGLYQLTPFYSVQYSKNGKYLLAAGLDFTVVWDASTWEALHVFPAYIKESCGASFSPDAEKVVTIVDDSVRVWTLKEKPKYVSFGCDNSYVTFADFSPDGKYLAFTTYKGGFMLMDAKTGKTVFSDKEHYTYIFNASFTPDGKEIVFTCCNNIGCGAIISFDIESKVFSDLTGTTTANLAIAISPDGKRLALPLVDRTIRVETFTSSNTSTVRTGNPNSFKNGKGCKTTAVSPDGKFRATIMNNNKIQMTHTASGNIVEGFATRKDLDSERFISFSPDGRYLICGSKYQSDIEVLDAATGKDIKEFYAGGADVECAIFSPDGRKIIAKLKDGKILEYDFPPLQELIDYAIKRFNYSR